MYNTEEYKKAYKTGRRESEDKKPKTNPHQQKTPEYQGYEDGYYDAHIKRKIDIETRSNSLWSRAEKRKAEMAETIHS